MDKMRYTVRLVRDGGFITRGAIISDAETLAEAVTMAERTNPGFRAVEAVGGQVIGCCDECGRQVARWDSVRVSAATGARRCRQCDEEENDDA